MTAPALRPQKEARFRANGPRSLNDARPLHRRFRKTGLAGFADHEVIELLLTLASPAADAKPAARDLLQRFGRLRNVLDASPAELRSSGLSEPAAVAISIIRETANRYLQHTAEDADVLLEPEKISDFGECESAASNTRCSRWPIWIPDTASSPTAWKSCRRAPSTG